MLSSPKKPVKYLINVWLIKLLSKPLFIKISDAIKKDKNAEKKKKCLKFNFFSSTTLVITKKNTKNLKNEKDLTICSLKKILLLKLPVGVIIFG